MATEGNLRVWWIPQVPMHPFRVDVPDVASAIMLMDALGRYDTFQFENNIKPDYCNAGGLEVFERGEWVEWMPAQVDHQAAVIRTQAAFEESKKLHDEISAHVFAERARLKAEAAGNLGDCNKIPPSQQELRK